MKTEYALTVSGFVGGGAVDAVKSVKCLEYFPFIHDSFENISSF